MLIVELKMRRNPQRMKDGGVNICRRTGSIDRAGTGRIRLAEHRAATKVLQAELQEILRRLYPGLAIWGNFRDGKTYRSPISVLEKAITQLGLQPHSTLDAIRDNADSLMAWGLVRPRPIEDDWQREGRELGIQSRWSPRLYPAIDPELKKKLEAES